MVETISERRRMMVGRLCWPKLQRYLWRKLNGWYQCHADMERLKQEVALEEAKEVVAF